MISPPLLMRRAGHPPAAGPKNGTGSFCVFHGNVRLPAGAAVHWQTDAEHQSRAGTAGQAAQRAYPVCAGGDGRTRQAGQKRKSYLRAVLLNAPMTMEHYYEAEVDRLLAGG